MVPPGKIEQHPFNGASFPSRGINNEPRFAINVVQHISSIQESLVDIRYDGLNPRNDTVRVDVPRNNRKQDDIVSQSGIRVWSLFDVAAIMSVPCIVNHVVENKSCNMAWRCWSVIVHLAGQDIE